MKRLLLSSLFVAVICMHAIAQQSTLDSFRTLLANTPADTHRVNLMLNMIDSYTLNSDSAFGLADDAYALARQLKYRKGELRALEAKSARQMGKGNNTKALELAFMGLKRANDEELTAEKAIFLYRIGTIFLNIGEYSQAITYLQQSNRLFETLEIEPEILLYKLRNDQNIGATFMHIKQYDSSYKYLRRGNLAAMHNEIMHPPFLMFSGELLFRMGHRDTAFAYLHNSILLFREKKAYWGVSFASRILAQLYRETNVPDSAIFYAKQSLAASDSAGIKNNVLISSQLLAELYETNDIRQALFYRKIYEATMDTLYGREKVRGLEKAITEEQDRQRKIETERTAYNNRIKVYGLVCGLIILLLVAFLLYRNNVQRKKSNQLLQIQKEKVEITLQELKATQAQLIQSEKMASLGELTAGIAHEIQNPLNFVNNFSEVNQEMIDELQTELSSGNIEEAIGLSNDIKDNEKKIHLHGVRADAIVKGMLQHSQKSSGMKEPTDVNALCDEYLRLAYQSLRTKDETFVCELKKDFDKNLSPDEAGIGRINIVPQDIGRVLLNLLNNAFYTCSERSRNTSPKNLQGFNEYEPVVSVKTQKLVDKVEIGISDNGNGIPDSIKEKIFQPFFTTKPTGTGTGLGLSLSYDIVKAHGGEIKVESVQEEGTEFKIQLPLS